MKKKIVRKLYRSAYILGVASLVASMVLGAIPPAPAAAHGGSGAVWTLNSQCGPSQNINQYPIGASPYVNFGGGDPFTEYAWDIHSVSGGAIPSGILGSGFETTDADGNFCGGYPGFTIQPGDKGTFQAAVYGTADGGHEGSRDHKISSDNYRIAGDAPTNTLTPSSTSEFTATFTSTATNTSTPPNTATNTATNTVTNTSTSLPTFTNTATNTVTNTVTNTATNTSTSTNTSTATDTLTPTNTNTGTFTATSTATNTATSTSTSTATETATSTATFTSTPLPSFTFTDPCEVGCNTPNALSRLCNTSDTDYLGEITWFATFNNDVYPDNVMEPSSPISGLTANSCVDLKVPRIGDGVYAFEVFIVDLEFTLTARCDLQCVRTTKTATPVEPPGGGGGAGGVLIPVTGADFVVDTVLLQRTFQNLGFGILSIGLMMHGFSLRMKDDEEETE